VGERDALSRELAVLSRRPNPHPLLLIHGDKDSAYHDAQKLFTALRRLDRPVQLATYAGMGHVIYEWTRPNAVDAARRTVAFIRDHLGEPSKSAGVVPQ
jgi:dipeptidyl aminopeptidase/acylaminoacyl peptidase